MPTLNELGRLTDDDLVDAQNDIKAGESLTGRTLSIDTATLMFLLEKIDQLSNRTMELDVGVASIKLIQLKNENCTDSRDKAPVACAALEMKR